LSTIRGISFPFRVGVKGGTVMSQATSNDNTHLKESVVQIIGTNVNERVMEEFGSNISRAVFEPCDTSAVTLIQYEIQDAVNKYDDRINVDINDIVVTEGDNEGEIVTTVSFTNLIDNSTETIQVSMGGGI